MPNSDSPQAGYPAGLGRRLGAAVYDFVLLIALIVIAGLVVLALSAVSPVPLIGEDASVWSPRIITVGVWAGFYSYCWQRGGQTLGMAAWRIHLVDMHGQPPSARHIALRLLTAPLSFASLGIGYLWFYVGDKRQTWHDRLSGTMVVHIPKQP